MECVCSTQGPEAAGPSTSKRRQQRYRKEWELDPALKPWLQETSDQYKASCKFCNVTMTIELTVIKNYAKGKKHCSFFKDVTDKQVPVSTFFQKKNKQQKILWPGQK